MEQNKKIEPKEMDPEYRRGRSGRIKLDEYVCKVCTYVTIVPSSRCPWHEELALRRK